MTATPTPPTSGIASPEYTLKRIETASLRERVAALRGELSKYKAAFDSACKKAWRGDDVDAPIMWGDTLNALEEAIPIIEAQQQVIREIKRTAENAKKNPANLFDMMTDIIALAAAVLPEEHHG